MNTITPRLMKKSDACAYLNIEEGTFDLWMKAGRIPAPLEGTKRWDRHAIDAALDKASGLRAESSTSTSGDFDEWVNGG